MELHCHKIYLVTITLKFRMSKRSLLHKNIFSVMSGKTEFFNWSLLNVPVFRGLLHTCYYAPWCACDFLLEHSPNVSCQSH